MDEDIVEKAEAYILRRDCHMAGRLGFGIHGIVFAIESKNEEQFGSDWPMAQMILGELRDIGIDMHDPSPSNIRFR